MVVTFNMRDTGKYFYCEFYDAIVAGKVLLVSSLNTDQPIWGTKTTENIFVI